MTTQNTPSDGETFYAKWFAQQSPMERQRLIDAGLQPEVNQSKDWVFEVNPNHTAYAYTEDKAYDEPAKGGVSRLYTEDEVNEVIRRVVMAMQMTESPDALFQARCILIAFGIGDPPTETELAKQKGCSRQFVSKKVKRIQQLFNLSPSQFMRSEQACLAYSRAWHKNHKKPRG
ncbi:MAG: hypothetical protein EBU83_02205 [bacterium]|nr:hypothetical protein [Candidatus Aquidulcis sp.]